jgi:hypothetical protein
MAGLRTPTLTPPLPIKSTAKATQALKAMGKSAKVINKVAKATPSLSKGLQKWVEANRSKLKNPTDKQKAIFAQYDKLKKEGRLSNDAGLPSKNKPSQSTPKSTKAPKSQFQGVGETISSAENKRREKAASQKSMNARPNKGSGRDGKFGKGTTGSGRPSDGDYKVEKGIRYIFKQGQWRPVPKGRRMQRG